MAAWAQGDLPGALAQLPGFVVFDLETAHDAPVGNYAEKGLHECPLDQQHVWKDRSQIIEFAGVDLHTGARLAVQCRPEFRWTDVVSPAARAFAEDHGHDRIIQDETLPTFAARWRDEVHPFLRRAAKGPFGQLALVAHCGDLFDFGVLFKELERLQLSLDVQVVLFDPVRTLKRHFGREFGTGGQLSLRQLHKRFVPTLGTSAPHAAHRALGDCEALLEVLQHWPELRELLAWEVGQSMLPNGAAASGCALLCKTLAAPAGSPDVPGMATEATALRATAAEFVPGVPWAAGLGAA